MTTLFDTHFHVDENVDPVEYARAAGATGVGKLMVVGGTPRESRVCRRFAHALDDAWFAAGVHPHQARNDGDDLAAIADFADDERLVAIGEIGLDFHYEHSERAVQRAVFERFLKLALDLELPAVVHCRDQRGADESYRDASGVLSDFADAGGRFELHCFTGTPGWAETFLELGGWIGFTGVVTFSNADNVRSALAVVPLERLLIETDAPYLAPAPHRGKPNHSAFLPLVAAKIAELKGVDAETLAEVTTGNAERFFSIDSR